MAAKKRILFIDDDTDILALLKVKLKSMENDWDMHFAEGGRQALVLLQRISFDAVVSDLLMPEVNGIVLLNAVMKKYPNTIRIVLSGASDKEIKLKSVDASHQFVAKPFEISELKSTIARAFSLSDLLNNNILKELVAKIKSLPSLPTIYSELMQAIQTPDIKLSTIGDIISKDIGMTTKILQLANSAYFGIRTRVSDIQHAVRLFGLDTIKTLVLGYKVFDQFKNSGSTGISLQSLMEHSLRVGSLARLITKNEITEESTINDAFVSGMLHDVGKILFAYNFPKKYVEIIQISRYESNPLWKIEYETFGATHAEVGAYLLGLWRLPNPVIEGVAFHHQPMLCSHKRFNPLTAVHVANVLEKKDQIATEKFKTNQTDYDYLNALGLTEKYASWCEICNNANLDEIVKI